MLRLEESDAHVVLMQHGDVGTVQNLAGLHRQHEHPLQRSQLAIDFSVRELFSDSRLDFWCIERLRGGSLRVGPELTNGERESILLGLANEIEELDRHIAIEQDCCGAMHATIGELQQRVATLKRLAHRLHDTREREPGRIVW